jgi:hypothetical protein
MESNQEKISPKFVCDTCNFKTSNKFDYSKHLLTSKHLKRNKVEVVEVANKIQCKCGKQYATRSGLWKHNNTCQSIKKNKKAGKSSQKDDNIAMIMTVVKDLLHNNNEVQTKLFELLKDSGNNTINSNNINNTTNNNRFNLNFFLNEQCKDAMNLMDFVKSLEINMQDVENVGKLGYVEGISNIILNGLSKLDVYQRPIHCSDLKRESVHIKDENIWELDKDKKIFTSAIKHVACKNVKKISDWKTENPQWNDFDSKVHELYTKMLYESMGPTTPEDKVKYFGKIINNISKEVTIDKGK